MNTIPATSGIYRIYCSANRRFYIGSAHDLRQRWCAHRGSLQKGTHYNRHLQRAWNKYGEAAFTFEVLELVLPMFLLEREQYWLDKLKPFGRKGYNLAPTAGSSQGRQLSEATRQKISASGKGRISPRKGVTLSAETRKKLSNARIGKPAHNKGKKATPEACAKMRAARRANHPWRGKKHSPEAIEKIRQAKLGTKLSPETCAKISAAKKARHT